MRSTLRIGVLFSSTGSYGVVGSAMRAGAEIAIDEVNASSGPLTISPVFIDPNGQTHAYADAARRLVSEEGVTHVIGCYTSSSRKEVLPIFEKHDALLWYPSHYEGFESSENVIYTGAAPNQHIIPLAAYLLKHHGSRGWFVGSNYVWAWENNRILREALSAAGGTVLGERYFPVGETDLAALVRQVIADRPDFVFTTLIGESCYQFFRMFRATAEAAGIDQATDMPIASCSLSEVELPNLGRAAAGHLSSSVYFSSIDTPENSRFRDLWDRSHGHLGQASADAEATYIAVHMLARAAARAGETGFHAVREAARGLSFVAPQGAVTIDPENLHCAMRPRIGRSTAQGTFDILFEQRHPVWPDPYLVWSNADGSASGAAPRHLKVVP